MNLNTYGGLAAPSCSHDRRLSTHGEQMGYACLTRLLPKKLYNGPGDTVVGVSLKWGWMVTGSVEFKRAYTMLDRITEHCN